MDEKGCGWFLAVSLLLIPCFNTLFLFQLCHADLKTPTSVLVVISLIHLDYKEVPSY